MTAYYSLVLEYSIINGLVVRSGFCLASFVPPPYLALLSRCEHGIDMIFRIDLPLLPLLVLPKNCLMSYFNITYYLHGDPAGFNILSCVNFSALTLHLAAIMLVLTFIGDRYSGGGGGCVSLCAKQIVCAACSTRIFDLVCFFVVLNFYQLIHIDFKHFINNSTYYYSAITP